MPRLAEWLTTGETGGLPPVIRELQPARLAKHFGELRRVELATLTRDPLVPSRPAFKAGLLGGWIAGFLTAIHPARAGFQRLSVAPSPAILDDSR